MCDYSLHLVASRPAKVGDELASHHNLFDYDLPAQPTLINVKRNGQDIPAVAQPTKTGFLCGDSFGNYSRAKL
jgi:hypothetical protein